eukprot:15259873-Ditylum_brightwellii.AAC.1
MPPCQTKVQEHQQEISNQENKQYVLTITTYYLCFSSVGSAENTGHIGISDSSTAVRNQEQITKGKIFQTLLNSALPRSYQVQGS